MVVFGPVCPIMPDGFGDNLYPVCSTGDSEGNAFGDGYCYVYQDIEALQPW